MKIKPIVLQGKMKTYYNVLSENENCNETLCKLTWTIRLEFIPRAKGHIASILICKVKG
jgi:hypothetical protein